MLITIYLDGWVVSSDAGATAASVAAPDTELLSLDVRSSAVAEAGVAAADEAEAGDAPTVETIDELHDWFDVLFLLSFGSFDSFGSFVCPFFGPRFFGGGAFDIQP